ncbi:septum formation initiator family protein [Candidatus Foliamicus sp.]
MRAKRFGILLGGIALVGLQYALWFADDGLGSLFRVQEEVAEQARDNAALRERNRRLAAEVEDLRAGDEEIERLARSELGMVGPGEKMYLLVDETSENAPPARPAPATDPEN